MKFKVGDIVRGKKDNHYIITTEEMTKGKVVEVYDHYRMKVKILEHKDGDRVGVTYPVDNDDSKFELADTELDKLQRKLEKHENKVKEIKEKIKDLNAIKVGDKVKVVNNGLLYGSYTEWVEEHIDDDILQYSYDVKQNIDNGVKCEVLHIGKHGVWTNDTLAYIQNLETNRCYLINVKGLEKC